MRQHTAYKFSEKGLEFNTEIILLLDDLSISSGNSITFYQQ